MKLFTTCIFLILLFSYSFGQISRIKNGTGRPWNDLLTWNPNGIPNNLDSTTIKSTSSTFSIDTQAVTRSIRIQGGFGGLISFSPGRSLSIFNHMIIEMYGSSGTHSDFSAGSLIFCGTGKQFFDNQNPAQTIGTLTVCKPSDELSITGSDEIVKDVLNLQGTMNLNGNTLIIGTSTSNVGTINYTSGYIYGGSIKRWISSTPGSYLFPLGDSNGKSRMATVTFTSAPSSGGSLTATFVSGAAGNSGLPLSENSETFSQPCADGYWIITAGDGLTGGSYSIDINGENFSSVVDYTKLRILKRNDGSSPWTLSGNHSAGTGSNSNPTAHRTSLSGFSHFALAPNDIVLPIELLSLSFEASLLHWNIGSFDKEELQFTSFSNETDWQTNKIITSHTGNLSPKASGLYRIKAQSNNSQLYSNIVEVHLDLAPKLIVSGSSLSILNLTESVHLKIIDFTGKTILEEVLIPDRSSITLPENLSGPLIIHIPQLHLYQKLLYKIGKFRTEPCIFIQGFSFLQNLFLYCKVLQKKFELK